MEQLIAPEGTQTITVRDDETLELSLIDLDAGSRQFELHLLLQGKNAVAHIRGRAKSGEKDKKKWKVLLKLEGKNQTASLDLRGVADDSSLLAFDGSGVVGVNSEEGEIMIREHIVLFSDKARGHALPVLRVETDKVRAASHAATIAPFDEEMFFYLETRGIAPKHAKQLLLDGFLV